jgi:hypothetical protein
MASGVFERATEAANNAASGAMLALVGAGTNAMSRIFDTGIPILTVQADAEAQAGVVNMEQALDVLNDSFGSIATNVRTVVRSVNTWNAGMVRVTVHRLVYETNTEIVERETKRLAANVRSTDDNAVAESTRNVLEANVNFRKSMDDTFVTYGQ